MSFSHLGYPTNLSLGHQQSSPGSTIDTPSLGPIFPYSVASNHSPLSPFYSHATAAAAVANATAYKSATAAGLFSNNCPSSVALPISAAVARSSSGADSHSKTEAPRISDLYNGSPGETPAGYGSASNKLGSSLKPSSTWRPGPYSCEQNWRAAFYANSSDNLDLNNARRKNVTRESTATLKSWLQEHIKNPYPTKGEKIMLAIITKMTLTQVSTWFANARRRLKKENKMTWSPRNRADDEDDDDDDDMVDETENGSQGHADVTSVIDESASATLKAIQGNPLLEATHASKPGPNFIEDSAKPRIWSLAMTAASFNPLSLINNNSSHGIVTGNPISAHSGPPTAPRNLVQSQALPFNSLFGGLHPTHV